MDLKRSLIGVVLGGFANNREASLRSGEGVYQALKRRGYRVRKIVIDHADELIEKLTQIEVAFLCVHSGIAVDGTLQLLLEMLDIAYTGSGPLAGARAADPAAMQQALGTAGLLAVSGSDKEKEKEISGMLIATGILRIKGKDRPLVPLEQLPKGSYRLTKLDRKSIQRVQQISLKAHQALGCFGFSNVTLCLTSEEEIYVLGVEVMPKLSKKSALAKAAKASGISFEELVEQMLRTAVERAVNVSEAD